MQREQIKRVQASFKAFEPCGGAFISRVLLRLSDRHPGVRAFFPDDNVLHHRQLFATLRQIIKNLPRYDQFEGLLMAIGAQAARERVNAAHYHIIRTELLSTIRELSREDWSDELEVAWETVLTQVCRSMMSGVQRVARAA